MADYAWAEIPVKTHHRSLNASEWISKNIVLGDGEIGVERNTGKIKTGDGESNWSERPYVGVGVAEPMSKTTHGKVTGSPLYPAPLSLDFGDLNFHTDLSFMGCAQVVKVNVESKSGASYYGWVEHDGSSGLTVTHMSGGYPTAITDSYAINNTGSVTGKITVFKYGDDELVGDFSCRYAQAVQGGCVAVINNILTVNKSGG